MARDVKLRRRYDSSRRREQAAGTRRDILEAARQLFEAQGYTATSMAAVATRAGVSLKTVYLAFETKRGLFLALWHLLLRGDEEPVPVGERPWFREVIDEPDPRRQIGLAAHASRNVKERAGRLLEVLRDAAPAEPELADLWNRIQTEFYDNQRSIVESLAAKGALRPDLDVDRATDILWSLNHPSVYSLLAHERGWTADDFESWLAETLASQLLASQLRTSPSRRAPRRR
jgi:AcrR family transcriptional regulator